MHKFVLVMLAAMAAFGINTFATTADAGTCPVIKRKPACGKTVTTCCTRYVAPKPACPPTGCVAPVPSCGSSPCAASTGLNCRRGTAILDEEPPFGGPSKGGLAGGECVWVRAKDRCAEGFVRAVQGPPVKGGTRLRGPCVPETDAVAKKD